MVRRRMSPTYDLMLMLDTEADDERDKILSDVEAAIEGQGTVVGRHDWGVRPLSFEIRSQDRRGLPPVPVRRPDRAPRAARALVAHHRRSGPLPDHQAAAGHAAAARCPHRAARRARRELAAPAFRKRPQQSPRGDCSVEARRPPPAPLGSGSDSKSLVRAARGVAERSHRGRDQHQPRHPHRQPHPRPELRSSLPACRVCSLRIAVQHAPQGPPAASGSTSPTTSTSPCGAPRARTARASRKGRPVALDGRLEWREWETQDGQKRQAVEIVADSVQFLGGREDGGAATAPRPAATFPSTTRIQGLPGPLPAGAATTTSRSKRQAGRRRAHPAAAFAQLR